MDQNVVVLSFAEESRAFEALSLLKNAVGPQLKLHNAVVVQRDAQGMLNIRDQASDGAVARVALNGTLIGALVGMLAGPLGILLGGVYGAVFGDAVALDRAEDRASVVDQIGTVIPQGSTALIAQVDEADVAAVDAIAKQLEATLLRRPLEAVQAEVRAQKEAHDIAAQAAVRALRLQHLDKWEHKVEDWKNEVKASAARLKARISSKS
ncbi:DUF1269 domain-containing family protein [Comamonas kerstersii]|uniref:DUF1269 domain-containing family protein n=1 Tax=Comamonas kerstersii TaxID=225992 RepID=A0A1V3TMG9_9BURK|nr:DUF1269 domain-containing protein [Comamonas kerstersii]AQZ98023.1 DUF1269 domain-containing family protein [Comamonas kerstersii]OOH87046.1 hypothetical protein BMF38_08490 [Comamonas kerstersii]OOH89938.1 hypothetical protein BMF29_13240 [Comamonas kerstersii]